MSLNGIDKTRASRTEDELRALVGAIYDSPAGTQETNWLEWKRALDLTTAEGRFAVAKAILGFANRSVAQAQLAFEGVAYMVVGVEPGSAAGVPNFDHSTLGQRIKTYADGPRWTPHYVPFSGVTVLVIVIEAPRAGDPIHTLLKEFSNDKTRHKAGTVFHRGAAHTEPAGPKEIEMLGERLLHGVRLADLDLALISASNPVIRLQGGSGQVDNWLRRHEDYVRANSGAPPPPPPRQPTRPQTPFERFAGLPSSASSISTSWTNALYAKTGDGQEFDRRVRSYLDKLRGGLLVGNLVRNGVRSDENKVYFQVGNETDDPVSGVQLTAVVPSSGLSVYTVPPSVDRLPSLPKWPDSFRDHIVTPASVLAQQHYDFDPTAGSVTNMGETFEITWDIGNLRPGEWSRTLEITIVADAGAPDEVEIELIARAMDRRRNATEKATVTISSNQWTVDDWFNAAPSK